MKKLVCAHADTCLPDYWSGHHLAHISVPVHNRMKLGELKALLHSEINQGAIAGNDPLTRDDSGIAGDKWYKKAHAAINRIHGNGPKRNLFSNIEDETEDCDYSVYAYFVFVEED